MKFYNTLIKYRLYLGILLIVLGVVLNLTVSGFWPVFPLYLVGVILVAGHFFFGPLRLIQEHMEAGNMEEAQRIVNSIKYPNLLYKPIRSVYYTLKGNMAMMNQDYDTAEINMRKGIDLGSPMKEAEGASLLQMGMLSMQKNDLRQAERYIREAIRKGLPDKENQAAAYLQMCSLMMNKRDMNSMRAAKDFFRKAKALKPTTPQIVDQIKQIEKYIARIPG